MDRRHFLGLAATLAWATALRAASPGRAPRILLRSSWQTVNIGDIAHTPGMLALLEKHLPEAAVTLWPGSVDNGVGEMLQRRFPKLRILVPGKVDVAQAYADHDFLLHGSGPSLVAERDLGRWRQLGPKPYGVLGITQGKPTPATIGILNGARFVFFRDGVSHAVALAAGVQCPVMGLGPDGAFATDLRADAKALAFLQANGLEAGGFLCCIPRYRSTPYWLIKPGVAFDAAKQKRNDELKEHDHAQLRAAIVAVVRQTKLKVLICPEDRTQMALGKEMLFDRLPDDVKPRVVWRPDYWLTDEALSVYVRSAGLFGNEMHSPIMCIGNGVPAIVCRWAEQTSKGTMWKDIGLGEWLFDLDDETQLPGIVPAVLALAKDPAAAAVKVGQAQAIVRQRQAAAMVALRKAL
ncbi:MAG: polysaccharide pyruvyl transferase family protein [Opitutales bacterium]|nr:polysaccharide pyruvyl transferase family protein [Opitutales bacterium]